MRRVALGPSLRRVLLGSLATSLLAAAAAPALAAGEKPVSIPAGPLEQALAALSAQTGDQLLFPLELVEGRTAPALSGRFTTEQALRRLLAAEPIDARRTAPRVVVLKPRRPPTATTPRAAAAVPAEGTRPFAEGDAGTADDAGPASGAAAPASTPTLVDEVRVTGTHIRGGSPAAPVITLDRDALERSGHATIAGALQALPQNFGGESTDATAGAVRADRQGSNTGFGTGVNLRGLGSDATLVLVNGRRLAGSGNKGDFTDVSSLPAIAVERVEVLLDGASALYGSDAVGGVVNVILRRDLDGGEVRLRGGAADGGPREALAGVTFGRSWSDGGVLLAYEAYWREALPSDKRSYTRSADLRPLGGGDYRDTFAFPGNIVRANPATGVSEPFWGVQPGQPGTGLRPTDFQAGVVNRFDQNAGIDVLPDQRRQVAYLAAHQALTPRLELSGDLRYAFRKVDAASNGATATLTVGRGNPFFVSPSGAASHQLQFNFGPLAGPRRNSSGVESLSTSLGADLELPGDWRSGGYAAFAQEIIENRQTVGVNALILAEALGNRPDDPATPYSPARDGYFNPFAGVVSAYDPALIAALTSGFSTARYKSQVRSANLQADGPVMSLPGGSVKAAVGAQVRRETFATTGANYSSAPGPTPVTPFSGSREVAAVYGELRIPLVGEPNARPGLRRLDLSAAVRAEHYSDFGRTVNPRLGLEWSPFDGVTARATYGESYRAPALVELYSPQIYSLVNATVGTARVATLAKLGGNPNLGPETAKTWTVGLDFAPPQVPGLRLSVTGFETRFDNRIDRPLVSAPRTAILTDLTLAPFVRRVSPATNAEDFAFVKALLDSPRFNTAFGVFQPTDFGAVTESGYVNTAGLTVRGIDVLAAYGRDLAGGRLSLTANGSWMLDYIQTLTPTSPATELVGRVTYPAKFRGRLTATWTRDGLTLGAAANHVAGFRAPAGARVEDQTTVDLNARLETPAGGWGRGVAFSLSVRNAFDARPPFYDNPAGIAFDAANADVIGRFVALQISKAW